MISLREVFEAPFVLRSETVQRDDGSWIRLVSYPELDCAVEGESYLKLLDELEVARVRNLAYRIEFGTCNLRLRDALPGPGLDELLRRAGLEDWIGHLDEDIDHLAGGGVVEVGKRPSACT